VTDFRVRHRTVYRYDVPVAAALNLLRLTPRALPRQTVRSSRVQVEPAPDDQRAHVDAFGNSVVHVSIGTPHDALEIAAESDVSVSAPPPLLPGGERWEVSVVDLAPVAARPDGAGTDLVDFALPSRLVPALDAVAELAAASFTPGRPGSEAVLDLLQQLHAELRFDPEVTSIATPLSDVVEHRHGVCQDFAHLAIGCLRSVGLAARYVSGYLETEAPDGQPKLVGVDASHAWCSVWLADRGWVDLDPTNGVVPSDRHVTVAWGRDYADVTPISGVVFSAGTTQELRVEVDVVRV
jgi:transglutaminase-like putative cysteine protease